MPYLLSKNSAGLARACVIATPLWKRGSRRHMTPAVVQYNSNDMHTRGCKHASTYDPTTFSPTCPSPSWRASERGVRQLSHSKHKDAYTLMQQALAAAKEAAHRAGEV